MQSNKHHKHWGEQIDGWPDRDSIDWDVREGVGVGMGGGGGASSVERVVKVEYVASGGVSAGVGFEGMASIEFNLIRSPSLMSPFYLSLVHTLSLSLSLFVLVVL